MMTSVRLRTRRGVFETRKTNTESKKIIEVKNQFEIIETFKNQLDPKYFLGIASLKFNLGKH